MQQRVRAKSTSGEEVVLTPSEWMLKRQEGYEFLGTFHVQAEPKKAISYKTTKKKGGCNCS